MINLEAYFKRISFTGETSVNLQTLNSLTQAHTQSIPFENLDVILDRPIQLSTEAIFEKLVTKKRGGYCFEQNGLFLEVLKLLGFEAKPLSARVRLRFNNRDLEAPRTHMFVRVEINGESFITDVGMGAASLTKALKLETNIEQETPHDFRRIDRAGSLWYHQIRYGEIWQDANEFTLEEMPLIDREVANWYTCASPQSHFRDKVIAARALDNGQRISLQNLDFTRRERNGESQKVLISNLVEFSGILTKDFGLNLSEAECESLFTTAREFAGRI